MCGPFFFRGDDKLIIRGVTYGTFAEDDNGDRYPPREVVRRDFAAMRKTGVNCVRTYTPPPNWLLDEARAADLLVLVGIYWDSQNCNFDDAEHASQAEEVVREAVSRCKHYEDVVFAYAIGNEIPPLVSRLHGFRVIERFLRRVYEAAKNEDPDALVTYGNYPSTEFLQLEFLDFHTINVYLLEEERCPRTSTDSWSKAKPSRSSSANSATTRCTSKEAQADLLDWTLRVGFDKGCAGLFVFAWTDEWIVGDHAVDDWHFGLVDRDRQPKPALDVVKRRFAESPLARREGAWPTISIVCCNYNGGETLRETLASLVEIDYPNYEVVYVDDGSTDNSLEIAKEFEGRIQDHRAGKRWLERRAQRRVAGIQRRDHRVHRLGRLCGPRLASFPRVEPGVRATTPESAGPI